MKVREMFGKKKIKSYSSVLGQFKTSIIDMEEIVAREKQSKADLELEKEKIDREILVSVTEIDDCQTAIQNIGGMFPALLRKPEAE